VTAGEAAATGGDAVVAGGDAAVAGGDAVVTRGETAVATGDAGVPAGDAAVPAAVVPAIRIERGEPTDDELAALIAALGLALSTPGHHESAPRPTRRWADSARPRPDRLPRPGPNAWRRSTLPSP
jgi:hypothetical protein